MSRLPVEITETTEDSTAVSASLIRRLGGNGGAALVYARILWRCATLGPHRVDHDETGSWWRATQLEISDETGLTRAQVRTALARLLKAGVIESAEQRPSKFLDRTLSYRPTPGHVWDAES